MPIFASGQTAADLCKAVELIYEITEKPNAIALDYNDVLKVLSDGDIFIAWGESEGEERLSKAIANAVEGADIYSARKILLNVVCSSSVQMKALEIKDFLDHIDERCEMDWGISIDDTLGDKIRVTILASGVKPN